MLVFPLPRFTKAVDLSRHGRNELNLIIVHYFDELLKGGELDIGLLIYGDNLEEDKLVAYFNYGQNLEQLVYGLTTYIVDLWLDYSEIPSDTHYHFVLSQIRYGLSEAIRLNTEIPKG